MKIHKYPGFFVAVEGLDGSGADLVYGQLAKRLKRAGLAVVKVKEPSSGPTGELIHRFIAEKAAELTPLVAEYLYAADRAWLIDRKITPALEEAKLVLSDRSLWSSVAYRSLDYPTHWLLEINAGFFIPDLTYFVDVSPEVCAANIRNGEDGVHLFAEEERLSSVREGYQWIFNKYPYWFKMVEGGDEAGEVADKILVDLARRERYKRLVRYWQRKTNL